MIIIFQYNCYYFLNACVWKFLKIIKKFNTFIFYQLIAVLREVHYLEVREQEGIPESAATIYSKNEMFRKYLGNLDLTVLWYNKIRETVLEVEYPLIERQLEEIDNQLLKAETELNWNAEGLFLQRFLSIEKLFCIS